MNFGKNTFPTSFKKFCIVAFSQTSGNINNGKTDCWITHTLTTITLTKFDSCTGEYIAIGT